MFIDIDNININEIKFDDIAVISHLVITPANPIIVKTEYTVVI